MGMTAKDYSRFLGMNRVQDPQKMSRRFLATAQNYLFTNEGLLQERNGLTALNSTQMKSGATVVKLQRIRSIFRSSTRHYIAGGFVSGSDYAWFRSTDAATWSLIPGTLPTSAGPISLVDFLSAAYLTIGIQTAPGGVSGSKLLTWDLSDTFTQVADFPAGLNPVHLVAHNRKLWAFGLGDRKAYFSATDNATDWTTANDAGNLDLLSAVGVEAGLPIGIASWGEFIVFVFFDAIALYHAGTDPREFYLSRVIRGIGGTSPRGILPFGGDLYLTTKIGILSLKYLLASADTAEFSSASKLVDPLYVSRIVTPTSDPDGWTYTIQSNNLGGTFMVNNPAGNTVLVYQRNPNNPLTVTRQPTILVGNYGVSKDDEYEGPGVPIAWTDWLIGANDYFGELYVDERSVIMLLGYGYIYQLNVGARDDASDFTTTLTFNKDEWDAPSMTKKIKQLELYTASAEDNIALTCNVYLDHGAMTETSILTLGTSTDFQKLYHLIGTGKVIQIEFTRVRTTGSSALTIKNFAAVGQILGRHPVRAVA